jgi:predicted MPP superfamily phosphohydrolase
VLVHARSVLRRALGILVPVVVGLAGAGVALFAWGKQTSAMGPFRVELATSLGPGVTVVALPPLGQLTADTHRAPLRFTATLQDLRIQELSTRLRERGIDEIADEVQRDALRAAKRFAVKVLLVSMAGAAVLGLIVFRTRWRRALWALVAALVFVGGSEALAWRTYRAEELLTPTYSGSLTLAPKLIGPARTALDRLQAFRTQLEAILEGAARVYASVEANPLLEGNQIRVLHISDVHLSLLGYRFARDVADAFDVDLVVDTGDLTSFGTSAEELILRFTAGFGRPYVFVRGNHDSAGLQAEMRRIPNVVLLDGSVKEVAGLAIYGLGHPVFTPDRTLALDDDEIASLARAAGSRIVSDLLVLPEPPDLVAVHDDRMAEAVAGSVPLVISGHFHQPSARTLSGTVFLRIGSTGGAGADVFTQEGGIPLSAEVLYFDGATAELLAYDLIEQSPETGSLTVERQMITEEFPPPGPFPAPPTSPSPSLSPRSTRAA